VITDKVNKEENKHVDVMNSASNAAVRCAIILAGGNGQRVQPFIRQLRGDALPKQYVNFVGSRSMLEHTHHRVEKLFSPEQVFTIVDENHLKYVDVCRQLLRRPKRTVILQPGNKGTGPGIFLTLIHIAKSHPDSAVAVFPSDHFILEEDLFMGYVELACRVVERDSDRVVLLGVEPYAPDPDYGYILREQGAHSEALKGLQKVSRFIEKPEPEAAQRLVQKGGLWNTMVMTFKAASMLGLIRRLVPEYYHSFRRIGESIGMAQEKSVVADVYRSLKPWNFSRELLEILPTRYPSHLSVMPMRGVFWSDWGSEVRILGDLRRLGFMKKLHEFRSQIGRVQSMPPSAHRSYRRNDI
jgi:mannose-1-phosphate guanylyltransferase